MPSPAGPLPMELVRPQPLLRPGTPLVALALLAAACGGGGSGDAGRPADTGGPVTTYVGFRRINTATLPPFSNLPELAGIARGDKDFASGFVLTSNMEDGAHEGLALDYMGCAYAADLDAAFVDNRTGIAIYGTLAGRSVDGGTGVFSFGRDRRIRGFSTTLGQPRAVAVAQAAGLLVVADAADGALKVFGTSAVGNVAPYFVATPPAAPLGLAYDEAADRLFAALADGTVAVFDGFTAAQPAAPDRVIVPSFDGTTQGTTGLRGIALDPRSGGDRVVVTDPGVEAAGVDGLIVSISGASTADGLTPATALSPSVSTLRDPVDVVVTADGRMRVADLQAGRVLVFGADALDGGSGAPDLVQEVDRPTCIVLEPATIERTAGPVGDLEDPTAPLAGLVVTVDPGASDGALLLIDESLAGPAERALDFGAPVNEVAIDALGNAFVCTSAGGVGSVGVINRFVTRRGTGTDLAFDPSRDRVIEIFPGIFIPNPSLEDPRGVDVDWQRDVVVVSDPGFPRVWLFGREAGDDAEAVHYLEAGFVAPDALPGGLDYDAATDRLFVAVSNGTVYVYDHYLENPGDLPDRVITPANALGTVQVSTSIRDVLYDATRDVLFATELGATSGGAADGAVYVIEGASSASGLTPVTRTLAGASTGLDDPSDLAWNGGTLWVVDTATETISSFADALTLDGDVAPTATRVEPFVRSVAVAPEGLAPATGGSILAQ